MLCFKATQVLAVNINEPKPWEMGGKSGVSHSAKLAAIGPKGDLASITLKTKTADELKAKMALYVIGKPAEIPLEQVLPIFKSGERKPSAYEYFA
jgi:hypothetical protein